ncbi:MAG: hypothetical protein ABI680_15245 [Chthoniobacteraceae bacterium]
MARRASSSAHPIWIAAAAALCLAAIAGGYFIYGRASDPYRTVAALPVIDYLENSNSLRGNVYKITGTISKSLAWSAVGGRLFAVEVGDDVLPVVVPTQFNHLNIERGQRYVLKIRVGDKGILQAEDITKS